MLVKNFGYYIYEAFQLTESYLETKAREIEITTCYI